MHVLRTRLRKGPFRGSQVRRSRTDTVDVAHAFSRVLTTLPQLPIDAPSQPQGWTCCCVTTGSSICCFISLLFDKPLSLAYFKDGQSLTKSESAGFMSVNSGSQTSATCQDYSASQWQWVRIPTRSRCVPPSGSSGPCQFRILKKPSVTSQPRAGKLWKGGTVQRECVTRGNPLQTDREGGSSDRCWPHLCLHH